MKKTKKRWIIPIVVLLILVLGGILVRFVVFPASSRQSVMDVSTMVLSKGVLTDSLSLSGKIYSAKVENVCSSVDCPIEQVYVKIGDKVKKGDLMAALDMTTIYADFDKAQAALASAKRELDTKTKDHSVNKILFEQEGITRSELEKSESVLEDAKEAYRNAETNYDSLQNELAKGKILAPIGGTVTEMDAEVGLKPPDGVLFVVEDTNDLYAMAKTKEFSIEKLKIGQDVLIKTNVSGDKAFKGKLTYISPKAVSDVDSTNVEFEVKVKINGSDPLLKIGMNAFLEIIFTSKENVYSVPFDTLVTQNGRNSVYVLQNNIVAEIPVKTGIETATNVEISGDGLQDGLKVVTKPGTVKLGQAIGKNNGKKV